MNKWVLMIEKLFKSIWMASSLKESKINQELKKMSLTLARIELVAYEWDPPQLKQDEL